MVRPKQEHLKGMEPVVNKEVENLADKYVEARDERMRLLEEEIACKAQLVQALKAAKLPAYKRGEYDIVLDSIDKVKVKIGAEEKETE